VAHTHLSESDHSSALASAGALFFYSVVIVLRVISGDDYRQGKDKKPCCEGDRGDQPHDLAPMFNKAVGSNIAASGVVSRKIASDEAKPMKQRNMPSPFELATKPMLPENQIREIKEIT
jgi:hypothetical protein